MATAWRNPGIPVPDTITLTLTVQEAAALKQVCNSIGGSPNDSARMYFDKINTALITTSVYEATHDMLNGQNTIFFIDQERSTL